MSDQHGNFVWYELLTSDADAAQDFYGKVLDWSFEQRDDMDYRMITGSDGGVGGIMPLSGEMTANGARPAWLGYLNVDDVDGAAASIAKAGGKVHREPWEITGVGRMAFVADAQGAMIYIMHGTSEAPSTAFASTEPKLGHCAWNELATSDQPGAVEFYTKQFGWKQEGEMDMGPMGAYQFFHHGPGMIGAVMAKPDEMPVSAWTYYFRVRNIDKALATIKANGGHITLEPTEIPGGEFQLNATDPQGAGFALVGPKT
ncbi:VOC family protein [Altererythrobacter aquiaggeris]|uniref:VOC family protein n=1 Tax=Aestuarierythrobacter aquiaggeris TaxID=1898396 RepID=UPI00301B4146